ncbi:Nudix hydrolase 18 [Nymphaea thermarum]|nr:Nudix hydrolase 18 [Nymphaea thermarum]
MVMMIARTGRENQRYKNGCRLVAGCIPYKLTEHNGDGSSVESRLQILVVKAQKSEKVLLPKGGWENDETVEEAALRETMEEAGVQGKMGKKLGQWTFGGKGNEEGDHVAHMFPLEVSKLHDTWPEKHLRERLWMSAKAAKEHFKHQWMREALDELIKILTATCEQKALPRLTIAVDSRANKVTATCEQKTPPPQWMRAVLGKLTATCELLAQLRARLHPSVLLIKILEPSSRTSELGFDKYCACYLRREQNTCGLLSDCLDSSCLLPRKGNTPSLAAWGSYPAYMEIKSQNGATVLGPTLPSSDFCHLFICFIHWWKNNDPSWKSRTCSSL